MKILILSSKKTEPLLYISAASSRDIAKKMIRVSSSNVWAIGFQPGAKNLGKLIVQFKGKTGGPGDVYLYYDVPVTIYRRLVVAPSKGHAFWVYIRNRYHYSKLTGDKRAKTPLGIN